MAIQRIGLPVRHLGLERRTGEHCKQEKEEVLHGAGFKGYTQEVMGKLGVSCTG